MKEVSDAWKYMGVVCDTSKKGPGHEVTEEHIETSADPQMDFSLAKYKLGAVIPFKISKIIEKAKGLWSNDQFHDMAIFLNIKSFPKSLAANLLAHKPAHLRPKYEKIIPTLQKLDFEDFASHVMINFPDRESTYSDGNWENIARYFYPRSSQILARVGTITLTGENPILNILYKTRFANIFIQIIFHTIIAGLLFLSAMVIYSVILKSVTARVYEVAIHRVVGLDKFDMVLMLMCNAAFMTLAGVLVGILITKIAFSIVNNTALNTERNELEFYLTFTYTGTVRSILIAMVIPQISSVLPIRDLLKGKIVDD